MKLLLDENLSRRMLPFLDTDYPDSTQVALIGLERASDCVVWQFAKANGFVIVTRDSDYYEMSTLYGQPPKVIWIRAGNQTKVAVIAALINYRAAIKKALDADGKACIEIY
ncbi:MAG: DUF5615 family PIN-like protein [Methylococcales bacterium]